MDEPLFPAILRVALILACTFRHLAQGLILCSTSLLFSAHSSPLPTDRFVTTASRTDRNPPDTSPEEVKTPSPHGDGRHFQNITPVMRTTAFDLRAPKPLPDNGCASGYGGGALFDASARHSRLRYATLFTCIIHGEETVTSPYLTMFLDVIVPHP